MILYLSSKEHMNILDFLKEEQEIFIKKYVGRYKLVDFLGKSIQRLGHIETIIIDLECLNDTDDTIINSIKTFQSYNPSRVVFYMDKINEHLAHELIGLGVFDIITQTEVKKLREEIALCLFEGMSESYVKKKFGYICEEEEKVEYDFKQKKITIGVVGSQHRVGTTTIAMQMACYLKSIGANVSYIEANDSGHMKLIAEYYKMQKNGEGYVYNGIAFEGIESKNDTVFDFIVYDMGVLNDRTMKGIENCDIRIVCAGDKPHEKKVICGMSEYDTIFSCSKGENVNGIYYSEVVHTLLDVKTNYDIFKSIIKSSV